MTKEVGTLAELNVKPGDVVEYTPTGNHHTVLDGKRLTISNGNTVDYEYNLDCSKYFRIVSRASDKPKLWRDMTPGEKGALLLAHHEGKVIEWTGHFGSEFDMDSTRGTPVWSATHAYRIKPEPKVETVTLMTAKVYAWVSEPYGKCGSQNTHRITFNIIDGEPDCTSIKMEKLQ